MAKTAANQMLDGSLLVLSGNVNRMVVCSQTPTTYVEAISTYALAETPLTGGDYAIGDDPTSGRRLTVAAKPNLEIDASGTAVALALVDTTSSTLLYTTACTPIVLTAGTGNAVSIPGWTVTIEDPV